MGPEDFTDLAEWLKETKHHAYRDVTPNIRIYFTPDPEPKMGFKFGVVEWVMAPKVGWDQDDVCVEILLTGAALWDEIRHVWPNEYWYYPDLPRMIKIFQALHEMEREFTYWDREHPSGK